MSSMAMKCLFFAFLVAFFPGAAVGAGLKVGFYNKTCPSAERLVQQAVAAAFKNNSGVAPGLIRLHFHDCFVRGCDASVLIDGNNTEKTAVPNNPSLRGFEVIDAAKAAVEAACPRTVSCADILAFAARDSIALTGNVTYKVPAGRRDGNVSIAQDALDNLPPPTFNATELVARFANKSLTAEDMVVLSGAHTIGVSHCDSFTSRLYNFTGVGDADPAISSAYALLLRAVCPSNSSQFFPNTTVDMDVITPAALDNRYYVGVANNLGLFTSDHALLTNATLRASVDEFVKSETRWKSKFVKAMVKMGGIEVKTGTTQGEVRLNCRVVNKRSANAELELAAMDDGDQVAAS
ncbi:peroxidase 1-like [Oryza glaberrima]|nr:peroxidase 1-like [Oryza glaberrima]